MGKLRKTYKVDKQETFIEIWEDLVDIKDLVFALFISSVMTLGGYFIGPNDPPQPLFFGLGGALIGFILNSFRIKPKRTIIRKDGQ